MTFQVRVKFEGLPLFVTGTFERDGIGIEDLSIESITLDGLMGRDDPDELFDLFESMFLKDQRTVTRGDVEHVVRYREVAVMDSIESLVAEQIRMG